MKPARASSLPFICAVVLLAGCEGESAPAPTAPPTRPEWMPHPEDLALATGGPVRQAVAEAQQRLAREPNSVDAWGKLGHVYMAHGWGSSAAKCYRRASELEPDRFRWAYYLGRSLAEHDLAGARDALGRAIELKPEYAPAHVHLGVACELLGQKQIARRHFERAATLDPDNPLAQLHLGQLALSERDYDKARDHLQRAVDLRPERRMAHAGLAQAYRGLGKPDLARSHLQKANAFAGRSWDDPAGDPLWEEVVMAGTVGPWFARWGLELLLSGDAERAVEVTARAISERQTDPGVWATYGTALLQVGKLDEALTALEKAAAMPNVERSLAPQFLCALYSNLAAAHAKKRNAPATRKWLTKLADPYRRAGQHQAAQAVDARLRGQGRRAPAFQAP